MSNEGRTAPAVPAATLVYIDISINFACAHHATAACKVVARRSTPKCRILANNRLVSNTSWRFAQDLNLSASLLFTTAHTSNREGLCLHGFGIRGQQSLGGWRHHAGTGAHLGCLAVIICCRAGAAIAYAQRTAEDVHAAGAATHLGFIKFRKLFKEINRHTPVTFVLYSRCFPINKCARGALWALRCLHAAQTDRRVRTESVEVVHALRTNEFEMCARQRATSTSLLRSPCSQHNNSIPPISTYCTPLGLPARQKFPLTMWNMICQLLYLHTMYLYLFVSYLSRHLNLFL